MIHSSLASMGRHATGLIASLSLCMAFNAAAQNANRYYYPVDKSLLEDFLSYNYYDMYPFIIVDENSGMAAQASATRDYREFLPAIPITEQDGYVISDNSDIEFKFNPVESKKADDMLKFTIGNTSVNFFRPEKHFNRIIFSPTTHPDSLSFNTFKFIFDESDSHKMQIQSTNRLNGTFYSLSYVGPSENEGFMFKDDNSKNLSIYRLKNIFFDLPDEQDDIDQNISMILTPTKGYTATTIIKYILNNGEEVSMSDLMASEHSLKNIRFKADGLPVSINLENYNPKATTLWVLPLNSLAMPVEPVFSTVYADNGISTLITAPRIADTDSAKPIYYTLQGIRVAQPSEPGIYICRKGANTTKILVK